MPPQSRGSSQRNLNSNSTLFPKSSLQYDLEPFPDTNEPLFLSSHDDQRNELHRRHESSHSPQSDGDEDLENEADDEARTSNEMRPGEPALSSARSKPLINQTDAANPLSSQHKREELSSTRPQKRPLPSRSQSALPRSNHYSSYNAFLAPPFYNRPPTPLPPSPSLTSLLRPPFSQSAVSSRPTTPESSDTEFASGVQIPPTTTSTTAAITSSARAAPSSFPRASPRVPTHEYYGFVLYITSTLTFLIYLLWSYLPSSFLHALGLTYYPDRWWSLAIPGWLVILVAYIYIALACYNTGYLTLAVSNVGCLVDDAGVIATVDDAGNLTARGKNISMLKKERNTPEKKGRSYTSPTTESSSARPGVDGTEGASVIRESNEGADNLDWRSIWNIGTDGVMDIPIGGVCEVLYRTAEG